ncbi:hypothetical protein GIB67_031634 [Kingdonia uniflora]|uniref:Pentatricopeptide repeat-containing protein n=1 Tax=Kingdonia uniflora TaxID=39325 RepID=A0A7J7LYF3_9MAGN|nr:hypothetical protein GIB67_031634 [Kingdonia uniflora]
MIDVLGKFSQFDLAWDLIEQMPKPDHATFRIMFKRYVSAHKAQQAIDTYNDRMGAYSLKDETSFTNLIDALCEYRHIMDAEGLFKSSLHCYDTKLNNMMLRGYSKIRWWKKCNEFWEEMERNGVAPDIHTYSIYMDIQTKCGKPWRAIKLYKEMKTNGIQLDVAAYNTVVRAAGLAQGVDDAIQVYREMKDFGVEPNIVTYNTIVKLLCEEGRVRQAYRLLDRMPERGCVPDVITYNCMFGSLERPKEILTLFERMEESGVSPRMDTYVMLLKKFGRWGLLRPIFIVWEKMKKHGVSPDEFAYSALIDALMEKGMIDMARKYEMEMLEKDLPVRSPKELGTKLSGRERDTE